MKSGLDAKPLFLQVDMLIEWICLVFVKLYFNDNDIVGRWVQKVLT